MLTRSDAGRYLKTSGERICRTGKMNIAMEEILSGKQNEKIEMWKKEENA